MFWGRNIKGGETIELFNPLYENNILNITSVSLQAKDKDDTKYIVSIINKNEVFQICTLDQRKDTVNLTMSFSITKGIKIKIEGASATHIFSNSLSLYAKT